MRDLTRHPGNGWALGAVVATFAHSLLALPAVQEGAFVPQLAVACVGRPIRLPHRVATPISVDHVVPLAEAARRRFPGPRAIFMTGHARVARPEDVPVVTKPLDLQLLAARVRAVLQG